MALQLEMFPQKVPVGVSKCTVRYSMYSTMELDAYSVLTYTHTQKKNRLTLITLGAGCYVGHSSIYSQTCIKDLS